MKKRAAAILLMCISLVLNTLSIPVYAETYGIFTYTVSNDEVTITKVSYADEIEIPEEINGYPVTAIGNSAFANCRAINIKIPASVNKIGQLAFGNCTNLTDISIPNSVTEIGRNAFVGCSSLTSVIVPKNLNAIQMGTFNNCTSLETIVIPSNVNRIESGAFNNCTSLATVIYEGNEEDWERVSVVATNNSALTNADVVYVESFTEGNCGGDLSWNLDENGVMTIGGSGDMDNWELPENVPWYYVRSSIKKVIMEDEVASVGSNAFYDCDSLEEVQMGKSVTTVRESAFADCDELYTIYVPASVNEIGNAAFKNCQLICEVRYAYGENEWNEISWNEDNDYLKDCTVEYYYGRSGSCGENLTWSLDREGIIKISGSGEMSDWNCKEDVPWHNLREEIKEIVFGDDVTSIGNYAFSDCTQLKELNIGVSVTTIGERAFADCHNLNTVTVPGTLEEVKNEAFASCPSIQTVTYEYGEDKWNAIVWNDENGDLKDREIQFLSGKSGLCGENLEWTFLDGGVLVIEGSGTMTNWSSAQDVPWYEFREEIVSIRVDAESIGSFAFNGCSNLEEANLSETVTSIGNDAFNGCSKLSEIRLPSFVRSIADRTFYGCSLLETYEGGFMYTIGEDAFRGCRNLKNAYLSMSLNSIGKGAFSGCESLAVVEIPDSIKIIEDRVFDGCTGLVTVTIPSGVKSIGNNSFWGCTNLKNVTLPESLETLGEKAFAECKALTTVNISENVSEIGDCAFELSGVSEFNVNEENENYSSIDGNLFNKDGSILLTYALGKNETAYTVPNSVLLVNSKAFQGSQNLESVIIPDNVTEIGESAFLGCENLESAFIGNGVEEIKSHTFADCKKLVNVKLGSGISTIGESAFRSCGIKEIVIPQGVTKLDNEAFTECGNLENIALPTTLTEIGERAFSRCESLVTITIPDNVTTIGTRVFEECRGMISAIIGEGITELTDCMFENCESLTNVTIPQGMTRIDNSFNMCENLKIAYYNGTIAQWHQVEKNGTMPPMRRLICWVTFVDNEGKVLYKAKNLKTDDQGIAASIIPSGCYEELYLDKELTQKYKLDTPMTENITLYVDKELATGTKTLVSDKDEIVDNRTLFTIKGMKLEEGSRVILSLYNNGKFMGFHNAIYFEGDIVFKTDAQYDKVKVMVWDEKKGFKPVTVAEEIEKVD